MSLPPLTRSTLTTILAHLLATTSGLQVGDGNPPDPLPARDDAYYVLYELPGQFRDADAVDLFGGATLTYQLTAVGRLRGQCGAAADRARTLLTTEALDAAVQETGLPLSVAACASDGPGATEPRGAMFNTPETYTVAVFRTA